MKTFILDIIPKIQKFSKKLDNLSVLTNKHWIYLNEESESKITYIFREKENQLLISENGIIEKANWEYLGNNSLLIDTKNGSFLYKHGFIDDKILALKIDGKEEYAILINEEIFNNNLRTITTFENFLETNYREELKPSKIERENVLQIVTENKPITKISYEKVTFDSNMFPKLNDELKIIKEKFNNYSRVSNVEILISFTKHHTIKADLYQSNTELCESIVYRLIPIETIVELFQKHKDDLVFVSDLENHIRKELEI